MGNKKKKKTKLNHYRRSNSSKSNGICYTYNPISTSPK